MAKSRRNKKVSTARRRAQNHQSGFEPTLLKLPDGVSFFNVKPGTYDIDIVPYKCGKLNPWADEGEEHYELTYHMYRDVGAAGKKYVCPSETFGEKDYIKEYRQEKANDPNVDQKVLDKLIPKERQIFLVWDHDEKEKGVQVFEFSYHLFGKLLDTRVDNSREEDGWDLFYYTDEDGMTLRLTVEEDSVGTGSKFPKVSAIDFMKRDEPLPKEIANHGLNPEDFLVRTPYDKLKAIFLGQPLSDIDDESNDPSNATPAKTKPREEKSEKKEKPEEEKSEKKREKKKNPTADEYGFKQGDQVLYEDKEWTILRVSGDGTSLTLVDDDDNVDKGIGPDEVEKVEEKGPAKEPDDDVPFDEDEKAASASSDDEGDDDWDDWD